MASTTWFGMLTLAVSVPLWAGGVWLVRDARAAQPPAVATPRRLPATVLETPATPCSARRNAGTCFRTVATYTANGQARQVMSRSRYRPARHQRGDTLAVIVESDGTAWIDVEWHQHQETRRREFHSRRQVPLLLGWSLVGCAAFATLLGLGLIFWVDRTSSR